jgi:hypothetical protein
MPLKHVINSYKLKTFIFALRGLAGITEMDIYIGSSSYNLWVTIKTVFKYIGISLGFDSGKPINATIFRHFES